MDAAERFQQAEGLLQSGRTDLARPLIVELMRAAPDSVEAWYLRGVCETLDGELDLAEAAFRDVIRRSPTHDMAFFGLGVVLKSKGSLNSAIGAWQQAVAINPANKQAAQKLAEHRVSKRPVRPPAAAATRRIAPRPPARPVWRVILALPLAAVVVAVTGAASIALAGVVDLHLSIAGEDGLFVKIGSTTAEIGSATAAISLVAIALYAILALGLLCIPRQR